MGKEKEAGKRKCGREKDTGRPFRWGLLLPAARPAHLVAETLTEWKPAPPAPCGAAFSAYIHLCPTHSRCSVNVC